MDHRLSAPGGDDRIRQRRKPSQRIVNEVYTRSYLGITYVRLLWPPFPPRKKEDYRFHAVQFAQAG
jgi:hypothetical protein